MPGFNPWSSKELSEQRLREDILVTSETLHQSVTGIGDPLGDEEEARFALAIRVKLANWSTLRACNPARDAAIHALLLATLAEYDNRNHR